MYSAHVGPDVTVGGPVGFLLELARGRSSALFALLVGFSLVIITGRPHRRTGRAGRQAVCRIVIRSVILVVLGFTLTALDTDIDVILAYYGLLFLFILPLYRLRAGTLAIIALVGALVLPQVLYVVHQSIDEGSWAETVIAWDPLARITHSDGFLELLFTGEYPVVTWLPFVIAGMAVARLDLSRPGPRARLALAGGALAVLGYGGSWLALHVVRNAICRRRRRNGWWLGLIGLVVRHRRRTHRHHPGTVAAGGRFAQPDDLLDHRQHGGRPRRRGRVPRGRRSSAPPHRPGHTRRCGRQDGSDGLRPAHRRRPGLRRHRGRGHFGTARAPRLHRYRHAPRHGLDSFDPSRSLGIPAPHRHPARAPHPMTDG